MYNPSLESGVAHQAQLELMKWSVPQRMQYADLAGRYVAALESSVNAVAGEAQLLTSTRLGRAGDAEVVAWRIDGDIADGEFDFATRASMTVSRADERTSTKDYLLSEPITPHKVTPVVRKELGAKGLYVAGVEYKKVPLKKMDGPLITINNQYAKFARVAESGHTLQAYAADHKQQGEVVCFPRLTSFETLESLGYAAFCLLKVDKATLVPEIANALARAAEKDRTAPYKPDNLREYADLTAGLPRRVEDKIRQLGNALYKHQSDAGLSPDLLAALLDPDAGIVAELAQLNKSKYVRPIPKSREFTSALNNQLAVVAEYASRFQGEVYPLMRADKEGYEAAMNRELAKVRSVVDDAEAFSRHLSAPETISLDPKYWAVRGSL